MQELLSLSDQERQLYFNEATSKSKTINNPRIIEKDFWVCWALDKVFTLPDLKDHLIFKGGTSLSKCYKAINRFSEDCDLTLSREYCGINESYEDITKFGTKKKNKFVKELQSQVNKVIIDKLYPSLKQSFKLQLNKDYQHKNWSLLPDPDNGNNLLFSYPSVQSSHQNEYIQTTVILEFGARGETQPSEEKEITPYVYELLDQLIDRPKIKVKTLKAERTFWEKISLLHAEHHRPESSDFKSRLFRHYYDVVMLDQKEVSSSALNATELLENVIKNNKIFFRSAWAHYETAKIGSLTLQPNRHFIDDLKSDCKNMADMFFGKTPQYEEIMDEIKKIEQRINSNT